MRSTKPLACPHTIRPSIPNPIETMLSWVHIWVFSTSLRCFTSYVNMNTVSTKVPTNKRRPCCREQDISFFMMSSSYLYYLVVHSNTLMFFWWLVNKRISSGQFLTCCYKAGSSKWWCWLGPKWKIPMPQSFSLWQISVGFKSWFEAYYTNSSTLLMDICRRNGFC